MLRLIGGIFLGGLTIAVVDFAALSAVYWVMGADWALESGKYYPTLQWDIFHVIISTLVAIVAGSVARWLGRTSKTTIGLILLVLTFGVVKILTAKVSATSRSGTPDTFDAMVSMQASVLVIFTLPVLRAVGVFIGGFVQRISTPANASAT